jgi:peptide/nickel transport system permease protein
MTVAPGGSPITEDAGAVGLDVAAIDGAVAVEGRSPWQIVRMRLRRDKVTMVALVITVLLVLMAILAPILAALGVLDPYTGHIELVQGLGSIPDGSFGGVSGSHPLGVEPGTGRDLLSRVLLGITTSVLVATLATIFAVVVGTSLGLVAGFSRGRVDWLISRFLDLILSFPQTLMLLTLAPVLTDRVAAVLHVPPPDNRAKITLIAVVLGVFGFPFFARIVRGQVLSLREREFVEAARSLGASSRRIYVKELLPHLWAPLLVYTTLTLPQNIAAEAALGFLGVGIQAPTPSLGALLNDSVSYALPDPAYFIIPGLTVFLLVLAFNLLGDGLRDALDPKSGRS